MSISSVYKTELKFVIQDRTVVWYLGPNLKYSYIICTYTPRLLSSPSPPFYTGFDGHKDFVYQINDETEPSGSRPPTCPGSHLNPVPEGSVEPS